MKKALAFGIPGLCLVVVAPMLVAALLVGMASSSASCALNAASTTSVAPAVGAGNVRVAQANLKSSLSTAAFNADLTTVTSVDPDLVSLNEVSTRSQAELTPPGYSMWRDPTATGQQRSTAVLWRTPAWQRLASGRLQIVDDGPQEWDAGRSATWVTLRGIGTSAAAGTVSIVSVHHMINPARYGPDQPLRQHLYLEGMQRIATLVSTLSTSGPVFVAGDFNSQWTDNDPWGPRAVLGGIGMKTSMDELGVEPTHDGGGTIDYLFSQVAAARPVHQQTAPLNSDHRLLWADFQLGVTDVAGGGKAQETATSSASLTATQWLHATQVVAAGQQLGVPAQGIVIALAVVSQESDFQVYANDGLGGDLAPDQAGIAASLELPHDAVGTDHGSLGLFQQQWPWWGTMPELMDPTTSADKFFDALLAVPGWQGMPITVAAQAVQHSETPDAYAEDESRAIDVYALVTHTRPGDLSSTSTGRAACAMQNAAVVSDAVVYPVPANLADTDEHNWGGTGSHWVSWHTGTDFAVPCGTPVLAAHAGTVQIDTTQAWAGPHLVKVAVGPGQLTTWYAHMQTVLVTVGQTVSAGQQVGEVGDLGNATGCHLHFEVHTQGGSIYGSDNVNPSTWLAGQSYSMAAPVDIVLREGINPREWDKLRETNTFRDLTGPLADPAHAASPPAVRTRAADPMVDEPHVPAPRNNADNGSHGLRGGPTPGHHPGHDPGPASPAR